MERAGERGRGPDDGPADGFDSCELPVSVALEPDEVAAHEARGGAGVGETDLEAGGPGDGRALDGRAARPENGDDPRHGERVGLVADRQAAPGCAVPVLPVERRPLLELAQLDVEEEPELVSRQRPVETKVERRRRILDRPERCEGSSLPAGILGVVLPAKVVQCQDVLGRLRLGGP